jgi:hypothetical protein
LWNVGLVECEGDGRHEPHYSPIRLWKLRQKAASGKAEMTKNPAPSKWTWRRIGAT